MGNAVLSANAGARLVALETQIKRFDRSYRRRLRKFTRTSSRHGDLLFTFPAIAFALVSGRGATDQRAEAARLVRDGAQLAHIAGVLDLPNWMRRLPPEAFTRPIGKVATGQSFGRKVVGRLPQEADRTATWLQAHEVALDAGDEDFAYWLAGQRIYAKPFSGDAPIRPLAIYAWYSRQDDVRGRRLMDKPWDRNVKFPVAVREMCAWYERVMADLTRADLKRGPGRYSKRRRGHGYEMVPLRSAAELSEEGMIMHNCVGSYAGMVAARECRIFSVRRGSHRVATLEVRWQGGMPRIWQLEAPDNVTAPQPVWDAVTRWLATQEGLVVADPSAIHSLSVDATRWKALWLPYVNAKGSKSLPLERPDPRVLGHLVEDIGQLVVWARG
ncbi:MAG: hypothetical protein ACI89J_001852 [Hyphomicrobiaceae bacterium]|jgi:hypothetical protein